MVFAFQQLFGFNLPTHSDYMGIYVYSTHIQSGIIFGLECLHGLFVNKPDDVSTFDTNGGNW